MHIRELKILLISHILKNGKRKWQRSSLLVLKDYLRHCCKLRFFDQSICRIECVDCHHTWQTDTQKTFSRCLCYSFFFSLIVFRFLFFLFSFFLPSFFCLTGGRFFSPQAQGECRVHSVSPCKWRVSPNNTGRPSLSPHMPWDGHILVFCAPPLALRGDVVSFLGLSILRLIK